MKRVTVTLDLRTHKLLALLAKRTGSTISGLIREAIEETFVKRSYYRTQVAKRKLDGDVG